MTSEFDKKLNNTALDAQKSQKQPLKRPNESGVIHVEGFVRITDPQTQEVILESRA